VQSVRMNEQESSALFEELKILLVRYLAPYLDPPSGRKKI